jgi:ribonuclease HI
MIIYCDGSCRGNGKSNSNGGYGVVVLSDEQILLDCY